MPPRSPRSTQREPLPIVGFALKENRFDGIFVGSQKGDSLVYVGKADHGFDPAAVKGLRARLKPLIRKTQPYAKKIAHKSVWAQPKLLAEPGQVGRGKGSAFGFQERARGPLG